MIMLITEKLAIKFSWHNFCFTGTVLIVHCVCPFKEPTCFAERWQQARDVGCVAECGCQLQDLIIASGTQILTTGKVKMWALLHPCPGPDQS